MDCIKSEIGKRSYTRVWWRLQRTKEHSFRPKGLGNSLIPVAFGFVEMWA